MKLIYLKSTLKYDSFDVAIGIKIAFFRVFVTIEPGRSLLQFVTTNCLMTDNVTKGVCDIRNSLRINQKEFKARGISAWIHLVVAPVLYLLDNEEKVKPKWHKVL